MKTSVVWVIRIYQVDYLWVNPLHAKIFKVNINILLHFMSFLHIDMTQVHVLKILPQVR